MKKRFRIYLVALLSLLLAFGSSISAFAADETGPKVTPKYYDVKDYPDIPGYTPLKIDPPDSGTYNNGTLTIDITDNGTKATWFSTLQVSYVYVKGGDCGYLYDYTSIGGAYGDSGLLAPLNGGGNVPAISHLVFYYGSNPPSLTGTVTVTKVMSGGSSTAEGIAFSLVQGDSVKYTKTIAAGDKQSDGSWKVVFTGVALGSYTLVESGSPDNYTADLTSSNNSVDITPTQLDVSKTVTNTYNPPTGTVTVTKVMSGGSSTAEGIAFSLVQDGVVKYTKTIAAGDKQSDGTWKVVFTGVALGNYTLVESGSPDNYTSDLTSSNNRVIINADHLNISKTVTNTYDPGDITVPDEPVPGGGTTVPDEPVPGGGTVVIDEPIPGGSSQLPKTGEIPPELFYGIGIGLTALGIVLKKKK